jgi:hypothetical protein
MDPVDWVKHVICKQVQYDNSAKHSGNQMYHLFDHWRVCSLSTQCVRVFYMILNINGLV